MGPAIAEIAGAQHGVIAAIQLRGLGLDRFGIQRRVQSGLLHQLHRGVYAVGVPTVSLRGRYLAAVLAGGPGARLTHRSAADLWKLRPNSRGIVEISIPRNRVGPDRVVVHRPRVFHPADFTVEHGIPTTTVARTLLDLGAVVRPTDLAAAVDRAERLGLFDLDAVVDVLDRANGRRGARALRQVIAAYRPSPQRSELERRFRHLLEGRGDIPLPSFNALVDGEAGTHEVDAWWPGGLAAQVDGFEFHRTRRDRERDAASDADLELLGYRVLRLTWDDVTAHTDRTLRRVRLALAATGHRAPAPRS